MKKTCNSPFKEFTEKDLDEIFEKDLNEIFENDNWNNEIE